MQINNIKKDITFIISIRCDTGQIVNRAIK